MCYTLSMSKITDYLNEHITGDVVATDNVRKQFATDGSILSLTPNLVAYPRIADDVRKVARFAWRLAERGQVLPITPRGNGTDVTGAAIGRGVAISFPAHMSQIMEFDLKYRMIRVQPGLELDALNQAVATQGLTLPISSGYSRVSTIGGMIATNAPGRQFAKYGSMRDWVDKLEVVLANGEIIQTGRLTRRELSEKKGLQTLEGDIYRSVDSLIEDNPEVVQEIADRRVLDGGYALDQVRGKDGSFDLTPLLVGSQGTLGIVTQAILRLIDTPMDDTLVVAALGDDVNATDLANLILELEPAMVEVVDGDTLSLVHEITGYQPWSSITKGLPASLMFIEFDDKHSSRKLRKIAKIMEQAGVVDANIAIEPDDVDKMMAVYNCVSAITNYSDGGTTAIPLVTELSIPVNDLADVMREVRGALDSNHLQAGMWCNFGSGLISVYPLVNLANLGQRQVIVRLMDKLSRIAGSYEGSLAGCAGTGRLLSLWAKDQESKAVADLHHQVKKAFDPYGILNPGVRDDGITRKEVLSVLRKSYSLGRLTQYNLRG